MIQSNSLKRIVRPSVRPAKSPLGSKGHSVAAVGCFPPQEVEIIPSSQILLYSDREASCDLGPCMVSHILHRYSKHPSWICGNSQTKCSKISQALKNQVEYFENVFICRFSSASRIFFLSSLTWKLTLIQGLQSWFFWNYDFFCLHFQKMAA